MELKDYKVGDRVVVNDIFKGKKGTVTKVDESGVEVLFDEPSPFRAMEGQITVYLEPATSIKRVVVHNSYFIEKLEK